MTTSSVTPDRIALPWATTHDGELTRTGVIVGSVIGTLAVFIFLPSGVVGIVLSCMGLDRITRDPAAARRFMRASWIVLVTAPIAGAIFVALLSALLSARD